MTDAKVERAQRGTPLSDYFTSGRRPTRGRAGAAARAGGQAAAAGAGPSAESGSSCRRNPDDAGAERGSSTASSGHRGCLHAPAAQAGALRLRPGSASADPSHAVRRADRRRVPRRARRHHHPPARRPHALRRAGRARRPGRRAAVPGRDGRHGRQPVLCRHAGRPGPRLGFKPGVTLEYWNGVPIDRAVQRHGEREVGGRPDTQRAWATQSLTFQAASLWTAAG